VLDTVKQNNNNNNNNNKLICFNSNLVTFSKISSVEEGGEISSQLESKNYLKLSKGERRINTAG